MNKTKLKEGYDEKILRDPFVTEATWLPSCSAASSGLSEPKHKKILKKPVVLFQATLPIFVAFYVAIAGFFSVHLGFDWGYYLVEKLVGQEHGGNQGITANIILFDIIAPVFFGMAFGCFKNVRKRHWIASIPVVAGLLYSEWVFLRGGMSFPEVCIYIVVAVLFFYGGLGLTSRAVSYLRNRIQMWPIYATCIATLSIMGLTSSWWTGHVGSGRELLLYSSLVFLGGLFSARFARVKNPTAAVVIPILSLAPLMVANFINVFGTTLSLLLDQIRFGMDLGWHAPLSACIITTVTLASSSAGGLLGFKWNRMTQSKRLLG